MSFITPVPFTPSPPVTIPPAYQFPFGNITGTDLTSAAADDTNGVSYSPRSASFAYLNAPSLKVTQYSPNIIASIPTIGNSILTLGYQQFDAVTAVSAGFLEISGLNGDSTQGGSSATLRSGNAFSSGNGGGLNLFSGTSVTGNAGVIIIRGGSSSSGIGGSVTLACGATVSNFTSISLRADTQFGYAFLNCRKHPGADYRMGFFNATPVVKPTGVGITAADIHAALVSLGLIAA